MNDEIPEDFLHEFAAACEDQTPMAFTATRYDLWCLMSAVQLASRHPTAMQSNAMHLAVDLARQIQSMIATTPALKRIAEMGWHAQHDAPTH